MRLWSLALLFLCSCIYGPELYPERLVLTGPPLVPSKIVFSDFYQLTAPGKVKVSVENMPKNDKVKQVLDISEEMATRLSAEGFWSEAKKDFSPADLRANQILIRGVLAKRSKYKRAGQVFAVASTITVGWFLYAVFRVLPVTQNYTIECNYEYFIEVLGPDGKTLLQKEGEILAEYKTRLVTTKTGKCQAPNAETIERIKENMIRDLTEYFIKSQSRAAPSSQPTTSAPATMP